VSVDVKGDDVQTIYDVGMEPEWKLDPPRKEPFCAVKGKVIYAISTFTASKNLTFETPITLRWSAEKEPISVNWKIWSYAHTRSFTTSNQVCLTENTFKYEYLPNGTEKWIALGEQLTIDGYVTWDFRKCPITDFTKAHIYYACSTAHGATTLAEIGNKIGPDAVANARFTLSNNHVNTPWKIIDIPTKSDCVSLCELMKSAIELLGNDSAQIWYVYARHQSWNGLASTLSNQHESCSFARHNPHILGFWNGGLNKWEACCRFQNKWWMGGLGSAKDHPIEVLRTVTSPNTANGHHQCGECSPPTPVSYPWSTAQQIPDKPYPYEIPNYP
jgi:hypothetical protein